MNPAATKPPRVASAVANAFDEIAPYYDHDWTDSVIGASQRQAVWRHIDRIFEPGDHILDLGCGTGFDAIHLAQRGLTVHATDVSPEMVELAQRRIYEQDLEEAISTEILGIEELDLLDAKPFDGIFSNFGAFNCVTNLEPVAAELVRLTALKGHLVINVMSRFCLWETLGYTLTGRFQKAVRRWQPGAAAGSVGSAGTFPLYYRSVKEWQRAFSDAFVLKDIRGIGIFVPSSYAKPVDDSLRGTVNWFGRMDGVVDGWPGFRSLADHQLLLFERAK